MSFLPQDYKSPSSSNNYMKLQEGENRIRILSKPILGWEDWEDKKPVRYRLNEKPAKSIDPKKPVKHFWAFIVFNCNAEEIQIMQVTQATIRKSLEALCKDKDWGDPYFYDIKINKSGEGVDTEYTVNPVPHKPVDPYIVKCFNEKKCNLEALFMNADPFSSEWKDYTPLAADGTTPKTTDNFIPKEEVAELKKIIDECPEDYKKKLMATLEQQFLVTSLDHLDTIPMEAFTKLKKAALSKKEGYKASKPVSALATV